MEDLAMTFFPRRLAGASAIAATLPVAAMAFEPVRDLDSFLSLMEGRELRLGLMGVSLEVTPDGRIEGEASGWPVSGSWTWQDGFFCREMDWGGTPIPYNCQLVEADGAERVRFTTDQGAGDAAAFNLR
jgi:hypothetical protein